MKFLALSSLILLSYGTPCVATAWTNCLQKADQIFAEPPLAQHACAMVSSAQQAGKNAAQTAPAHLARLLHHGQTLTTAASLLGGFALYKVSRSFARMAAEQYYHSHRENPAITTVTDEERAAFKANLSSGKQIRTTPEALNEKIKRQRQDALQATTERVASITLATASALGSGTLYTQLQNQPEYTCTTLALATGLMAGHWFYRKAPKVRVARQQADVAMGALAAASAAVYLTAHYCPEYTGIVAPAIAGCTAGAGLGWIARRISKWC